MACFNNEVRSCSQAVLATFATELGLDRPTALAVATAFGGGMARLGETCGAVTGAFMAIGLKHGARGNLVEDGRVHDGENEKKENTYRLVREFVDRFRTRHGSIRCKDILGCDLDTAEGRKAAEEKNLFRTVCPGFIRDAARILEEIL